MMVSDTLKLPRVISSFLSCYVSSSSSTVPADSHVLLFCLPCDTGRPGLSGLCRHSLSVPVDSRANEEQLPSPLHGNGRVNHDVIGGHGDGCSGNVQHVWCMQFCVHIRHLCVVGMMTVSPPTQWHVLIASTAAV